MDSVPHAHFRGGVSNENRQPNTYKLPHLQTHGGFFEASTKEIGMFGLTGNSLGEVGGNIRLHNRNACYDLYFSARWRVLSLIVREDRLRTGHVQIKKPWHN